MPSPDGCSTTIRHVGELLDEIGLSDLIEQMIPTAWRIELPDGEIPEKLLRTAAERDSDGAALAEVLGLVLRELVARQAPPAELVAVAERALELSVGGDEIRALFYAKLGSALKDARAPNAFIDLIGSEPAPWELALPDERKAMLWTERSNALRLLGRRREALAAMDAATAVTSQPANKRVARLNIAILIRELGQVDRAVTMLEELVPECEELGERIRALHSLATTYSLAGREQSMDAALREAYGLATGPYSSMRPLLTVQLAGALAGAGEEADREAIELLTSIPPDEARPEVLLGEAYAWSRLRGSHPDAAAPHLERAAERLDALPDEMLARGDVSGHLMALRAAAAFFDTVDPARAAALWERAVEGRAEASGVPSPIDLVSLSVHRFAAGRRDEALALATQLPLALADEIGASSDPSGVVEATRSVGARLTDLTLRTLTEPEIPASDVRLLAELRRDAVGRARVLAKSGPDSPEALTDGLPDALLARLAPPTGRLHVLEWLPVVDAVLGLTTRIDASGRVDADVHTGPDVDLVTTAARLRNRLDGWRPGRAGDPFDLPEWAAVEGWLQAELADATADDHVVVLEHHAFTGLPWHAVPGPWTLSYAPGWTALLSLAAEPAPSYERIGLIAALSSDEPTTTHAAFVASERRLAALAEAAGLPASTRIGPAADAAGLRELLASCDALKILCHGVTSPHEREVALLLAHAGALPTTHAVAASSPAGLAHRFSWRDVLTLPRVPRTVFSAACSSGVAHVAGLGDRLGMFSALRATGGRALVAPAWDAVADDVLVTLDDVMERHLDRGAPLGRALRDACRASEQTTERWRAWTLALEGDWR